MHKTIAVTGATGFIGRKLCHHLLAAGYRVRALARDISAAKMILNDAACEWVQGEANDTASLEKLVADTAAVVHLAGSVRGATQEQFDAVNVHGVRCLLKVLEKNAIPPRLLLMSSLAARQPELSYYAASKFGGEQVLQREAQSLNWTILRPPAVYGPGDKELMPLFRLAAHGFLPLAGSADARFSLLFIDDLTNAALAWLRKEEAVNAIYTLDDGAPNGYDWQCVAAIIGELRDSKVRLIPIPAWILNLFARSNKLGSRLINYTPMLTPEKLRELRHKDWVSDNSGFSEAYAWKPAVTLKQGLQRTPGWCRDSALGVNKSVN